MDLQNIEPSLLIALAVGVVIVAFIVIGFIKGVVRIILALVSLSVSSYLSWLGYGFFQEFTHATSQIPSIGAGSIGITSFVLVMRVMRFIINPFNKSKAGSALGFGKAGALLSLLAIIVALWVSGTGIRYIGSIAELRNTYNILKEKPTKSRDQTTLRVKNLIDGHATGKLLRHLDPVSSEQQLTFAKIMLMYHDEPTRRKMLKSPRFNELFNSKSFLETAYLKKVKKHATYGHFLALYHNESLATYLSKNPLQGEFETAGFMDQ